MPKLDRLTSQLYSLPSIIGRLGISVAEAQRRLNADYLHNVKELMGLVEGTLGKLVSVADKQALLDASKATDTARRKAEPELRKLAALEADPDTAPEDLESKRNEVRPLLETLAAAERHEQVLADSHAKLIKENNELRLAAFSQLLKSLTPSRYQFTETTLEFSADLAEHMSVGLELGGSAGVNVGVAAVTVNSSLSVGYGRDYRAAARVSTVLHAYQDTDMTDALLARASQLGKVELPNRSETSKAVEQNVHDVFNLMQGKAPGEIAAPPDTPE